MRSSTSTLTTLILSASMIAPALTAPHQALTLTLTPRSSNKTNTTAATWTPLPNTTATCADTSKYMSLVIGPENAQTILTHSCAAFMPACAYPEENGVDAGSCTEQEGGAWALEGPRNKTLSVLVESAGNKLAGWNVNFYVTPANHSDGEAVKWTTADCEGYINTLVTQTAPNGCLISGTGPGAGELTVGAPADGCTSSLTGTVVGARFVKRS